MSKSVYFQLFDSQNKFSSKINTTNLNMFPADGEINMFNRKFSETSGEK